MLLSRFWYVILALALSVSVGALFVATEVYNRTTLSTLNQALAGDTQVVNWFINDDARRRSSMLLKVCLDKTIREHLSKSSRSDKEIPKGSPEKTIEALSKLNEQMPPETKFSALFAVDQLGRVVGHVGFEEMGPLKDFELGGYPVVADALHGWVRDDTWIMTDGGTTRMYLVVTRPVEVDTSQMPAGAVVGLRLIDNEYARQVVARSGAAIGFFANGKLWAKAVPEGGDVTKFETVAGPDINALSSDPEFKEKGKTKPKIVLNELGVVFAKLRGEAWDFNAGYIVLRQASIAQSPLGLLGFADNKTLYSRWWIVVPTFVLAALLGLLFTFFEHSRPLGILRREAERFARGETDSLQLSKFRSLYRKIANDINDGTDKVASKGGVSRKAADLASVLGPLPAKPEMSAFSFPFDTEAEPSAPRPNLARTSAPQHPAPTPPTSSQPRISPPAQKPPPPQPRQAPPAPVTKPQPPLSEAYSIDGNEPDDDEGATMIQSSTAAIEAIQALNQPISTEMAEWRAVFDQFVSTKQQCGESTTGLTFEKFQKTLQKNREQLVAKVQCKAVKFTVYVKDGRAALKASPVR